MVNLDACELIHSHFGLHGDYTVSVALDFIAEVSEQFLPRGGSERAILSPAAGTVLEHLRESAQNVWRAVTYFSLWVVRLSGFLPALDVCLECGAWLDDPEQPERAFFNRSAAGSGLPRLPRRADSWEMSLESRAIAAEMLRKPVAQISGTAGRRKRRRPAPLPDPANGRSDGAPADHRSGPRSVVDMDSFQQIIFKLKTLLGRRRTASFRSRTTAKSARAPWRRRRFCACWGPNPYRVAYVQPSRRPADGRYGENPNRLYKHQQLQVILKPSPDDVIDLYLGSLEAIGIDLRKHDIKFEEDNWEVADAGGVGRRLAGDARWPGDHAVHLFPAVRRRGSGSGSGRADVRPGAAGGVSAGEGQRVRHRVGAAESSYSRRAVRRRAAVLGLQLRDGRRGHAVEAVRPA